MTDSPLWFPGSLSLSVLAMALWTCVLGHDGPSETTNNTDRFLQPVGSAGSTRIRPGLSPTSLSGPLERRATLEESQPDSLQPIGPVNRPYPLDGASGLGVQAVVRPGQLTDFHPRNNIPPPVENQPLGYSLSGGAITHYQCMENKCVGCDTVVNRQPRQPPQPHPQPRPQPRPHPQPILQPHTRPQTLPYPQSLHIHATKCYPQEIVYKDLTLCRANCGATKACGDGQIATAKVLTVREVDIQFQPCSRGQGGVPCRLRCKLQYPDKFIGGECKRSDYGRVCVCHVCNAARFAEEVTKCPKGQRFVGFRQPKELDPGFHSLCVFQNPQVIATCNRICISLFNNTITSECNAYGCRCGVCKHVETSSVVTAKATTPAVTTLTNPNFNHTTTTPNATTGTDLPTNTTTIQRFGFICKTRGELCPTCMGVECAGQVVYQNLKKCLDSCVNCPYNDNPAAPKLEQLQDSTAYCAGDQSDCKYACEHRVGKRDAQTLLAASCRYPSGGEAAACFCDICQAPSRFGYTCDLVTTGCQLCEEGGCPAGKPVFSYLHSCSASCKTCTSHDDKPATILLVDSKLCQSPDSQACDTACRAYQGETKSLISASCRYQELKPGASKACYCDTCKSKKEPRNFPMEYDKPGVYFRCVPITWEPKILLPALTTSKAAATLPKTSREPSAVATTPVTMQMPRTNATKSPSGLSDPTTSSDSSTLEQQTVKNPVFVEDKKPRSVITPGSGSNGEPSSVEPTPSTDKPEITIIVPDFGSKPLPASDNGASDTMVTLKYSAGSSTTSSSSKLTNLIPTKHSRGPARFRSSVTGHEQAVLNRNTTKFQSTKGTSTPASFG